MPKIKAVLWDVDDTLCDYSGAARAGARAWFQELGLLPADGRPEDAEAAEAVLDRWDEVMTSTYAHFLAGEMSFAEQRRERARRFLGTALTDAEADAWFAGYQARNEAAWTAFPDVTPALDALTPAYRHGVLSNSSTAHQEHKLRAIGLRDRFECLLCSGELGHAKPAPEAFLAACDALGLPPGEVAYIGDHAETDARGADTAGLLGIWLDRRGAGGVPGLRRIRHLRELPALLGGLSRFGAPSPIG